MEGRLQGVVDDSSHAVDDIDTMRGLRRSNEVPSKRLWGRGVGSFLRD